MRILLVEDDKKIASFILKGLLQVGYQADWAADGEEGYRFAQAGGHAAAIVDLMLPKLDGLSLIQRLRAEGAQLPVIILSAKRSVDERVEGLKAGGDDYLVKPFAFSELLARVQALLRRSTGAPVETETLRVEDLEMDLIKRKVQRAGRVVELQPREFALLHYLMRNADRVVSKNMIMEHVWGYDFDPQTNVVEARISRLRDKIDRGVAAPLIHTIRGVGYVLKASR